MVGIEGTAWRQGRERFGYGGNGLRGRAGNGLGGGVKTSTHKMVNYLKCTINRHFWCNSDNNVYYSHYFANTAYSIMPIRP